MTDENEKLHGFEIRMRQFAVRTIAFDEGVPERLILSFEYHAPPEKYRDVVSEIAGTAFVEIEEHRLSGFGSL